MTNTVYSASKIFLDKGAMHNDTTTSRTVQTQQGTTSIKCMVTKTGMQLRYSRRYIISYPFFASVVKSIPKPV
jgi:hypothetical protein